MLHVGIGIPSYGYIDPLAYTNHMACFTTWAKKYKLAIITIDRVKCAQARNNIVKAAMEQVCSHLLFIDIDHMMPFETIDLLLKADADVVSGLICKRMPPFMQVGYIYVDGGYHAVALKPDSGVISVDICAMGCTLIKMQVFDRLKPPYFVDVAGTYGPTPQLQKGYPKRHDVQFFENVRSIGGSVKINTDLCIGHIGSPYVVDPKKHLPESVVKKIAEEAKKSEVKS